MRIKSIGLCIAGLGTVPFINGKDHRPNIIYIMSDDHTSQAISAYGGILSMVNVIF